VQHGQPVIAAYKGRHPPSGEGVEQWLGPDVLMKVGAHQVRKVD
jgi:hypothetical protein